jgi:hydrogenase maturation protease
LVVCIGNDLVADDAAGCAVYRQLTQGRLWKEVRLEMLACGGVALLDRLAGERILIVVDAVQFGSAPGTVHVLDWDDLPSNTGEVVSAHGIGVREAIEIGRHLMPEAMPSRVLLIGIEGRCFDAVGEPMTAAVAAAVPRAANEVLRTLQAELRGSEDFRL